MKRDMDLVRKILLKMEARPQSESGYPLAIDGYESDTINFHVVLLQEAGLITAIDTGLQWLPVDLTWEGHEFLDAARSERRWRKAMSIIEKQEGAVPFEILKELLLGFARDAVRKSRKKSG